MPSIRMVVTDKGNKIADKTVTFTNEEWDLIEESLKGWAPTMIVNPNFDSNLPETPETNPVSIPAPARWNLIDQVEDMLDRGARAAINKQEKIKFVDSVQSKADLAKANKQVSETGDDVPVRYVPGQ